jgi:hypothetical protein
MRLLRASWLPIALAVLLSVACSSSSGPDTAGSDRTTVSVSASTTTSTGEPIQATTASTPSTSEPAAATTTAPSTTASSTASEAAGPANDAEVGLRFDIGAVTGTGSTGGTRWIRFDRFQFFDLQGPELVEEPRYELATDACCRNDNPALRTYVLDDDVEVLRIDPEAFEVVCGGEFDHPWDYQVTGLDQLLVDGSVFASLTFGDDGEVVRIREQTGC